MSKCMGHKLLITLEYEYDHPLMKLVGDEEFPQGAVVSFKYKATNVGDAEFPGGMLQEVSAEFGLTGFGGSLKNWQNPNTTIEPIRKKETKELYPWKVALRIDGLMWMRCRIQASDKQPIEYFQSEKASIGTNEWSYPFIVINKEKLQTIRLLNQINQKLDSLLKRQRLRSL